MSQGKPASIDVQADVNCLADKLRGHFRAHGYAGNDGEVRANVVSFRGEPFTTMVQFRGVARLLPAIVGVADGVPNFRKARQIHAISFRPKVSVIETEFDTRTDRVHAVVHDFVKAN